MRHALAAVLIFAAVVFVGALDLPAFAVIPDTDFAFLTSSASTENPSPAIFPSMLRPILAVLLIGFLMLGSLYLMYRRRESAAASDLIQVLAASPVSQGVLVQVIDVGGILFVAAISRNEVTLLGQITDREKISEIRTRVSQEVLSFSNPTLSFKTALRKLFRQRPPGRDAAAGTQQDLQPMRPAAREKILQEVLDRVRRLNPERKDQ